MRHASWGYLIPDSPFADVFPDGRVPLRSIVPIIPRDATAPPCYVVDGRQLTEEQIAALASMLFDMWRPECASEAAAAAMIRADGLPLKTAWFTGVGGTLPL